MAPLSAQKPLPTVPPGGGTSTITRPDSLADQGYGFFMANSTANIVAGGALSGKVEIQGSPLLWEPVTVVLSCKPGTAALTVQTDPKGNYTIDHTDVPRVYQTDDDALSTQIRQHYEGCSLQAPLPGYRSTAITITEKNLRDKPILDNIVVTEDEHAPGTAFSPVGADVSPEAAKLFDKAHQEWLHRNMDAAQSDLEKVVKTASGYAEAWYLLGRLQMRASVADAMDSFIRAHELDPRFEPPCLYLSAIAMERRHWADAAKWSNEALALDPAGTALLWYVNAQADYHLGRNEAALAGAQRVVDLDPEHSLPNAEDLLALTLFQKHQYSEALTHLHNSLNYIAPGPSADLIKRQIAFIEQQNAAEKK